MMIRGVDSGMIPGLLEYLDYPDMATLAMPNALLVAHGQQDTLFHPEGVKAAWTRCASLMRRSAYNVVAALQQVADRT
jgi:hypothetical protein